MIRILQVVNIMDRAGLETMLMNLYRNIDRSQVQFDFLTHRQEAGAYDEEITALGGHVYHAPRLYPQNYLKYYKFMEKFFAEHNEYKIVHAHIDSMSAFPLYAAKRAGVPCRIAHSHTSRFDKDLKLPIKYTARSWLPHFANIYCACGDKAGEFLFGNRECKIIHNAIDIERFRFHQSVRDEIRNSLELKDKFVIGHVGRFYYVKNQQFLLKIVSEIKKQYQDVILLLIGKGEDEEKLRKAAVEFNIADNVVFLIDRPDVDRLYQAMDVFVMPSLFEGVPVVGIEAQANGLPCLFSDNISDEILLTEAASKMSLNSPIEKWIQKILTLERCDQIDAITKISESGYNIKIENKLLLKWYLDLENSVNC